MAVYVMRTLRDFFHMGSVEWVTFQEPESHDRAGGASEGEGSVDGRDDGARRVTMVR
jgi:hypothetical protein